MTQPEFPDFCMKFGKQIFIVTCLNLHVSSGFLLSFGAVSQIFFCKQYYINKLIKFDYLIILMLMQIAPF
jgi:hypothetical protein